MEGIGVLEAVDLRVIWPHEALDFTPWLAKNLSLIGDALGMDLELQGVEAPVGHYSLDLLARDLSSNRTVVIENQIEQTDHDHLGKCLTYAAGHDASVVVWLASQFRDEHRQALDWLNQRTDQSTLFFGVVVEALRIDNSRPAVNFKLVASPNQWRKEKIGAADSVNERGLAFQTFFQGLMDELRDSHQFTKAHKAQPQNWYSFSSGLSGIGYGVTFAQGGRVRAEIYIDRVQEGLNKALFDALHVRKVELEQAIGEPLVWERLDTRRASRIAIYRDARIEDEPETLRDVHEWAIKRLLRFRAVFGPAIAEISPVVLLEASAITAES